MISSTSAWEQLRRTYSSSSTSRRATPSFVRPMTYWSTLSWRCEREDPLPPNNRCQRDRCSPIDVAPCLRFRHQAHLTVSEPRRMRRPRLFLLPSPACPRATRGVLSELRGGAGGGRLQ